ncbi:MAG: YeeE/YedE family protein [Chitinophagales bacterium]|nr:YeeE/YedE family protein [Chitinophagales bacterium]
MLEFLKQPWAWYVAGPLIGLVVPTLLILGNKHFGISSSMRHICAACLPAKIPFFQYDWKKEIWNLFFVGGILMGGIIAATLLKNPNPVDINPKTFSMLQTWGVKDFSGLLPLDIFGTDKILSLTGLIFLVIGGFMVGFGTRYGGGCTSGHAIMGLSNLQWSSLVATCCFMMGGILVSNFILPLIFKMLQ